MFFLEFYWITQYWIAVYVLKGLNKSLIILFLYHYHCKSVFIIFPQHYKVLWVWFHLKVLILMWWYCKLQYFSMSTTLRSKIFLVLFSSFQSKSDKLLDEIFGYFVLKNMNFKYLMHITKNSFLSLFSSIIYYQQITFIIFSSKKVAL